MIFLLKKIRRVIRRYPTLYKPTLRLRGHSVEFPSSDTVLHVTGFPRCATTFAFYIIKQFINKERITSHIHIIADIKEARYNSCNILVTFRNPADAISSQVVKNRKTGKGLTGKMKNMQDKDIFEMLIEDYVEYYKYIIDNKCKEITMSSFDTTINKTCIMMENIEKSMSKNVEWDKEGVEKGREEYKNWKNSNEDEHEEVSGLPNEKKERKKRRIKRELRKIEIYESEKKFMIGQERLGFSKVGL